VIQAEANRGRGMKDVGPSFVSFVSLATSSAHVDGVGFTKGEGTEEGLVEGRERELVCP
jgi:hypothetical protein